MASNKATNHIFEFDLKCRKIKVSGRVGYNSGMNGIYYRGDEPHCGRVYYRKKKKRWAIRWHPETKHWLFDCEGLGTISCAKVEEDVQHPLLVSKEWEVCDGNKHKKDPAVKIEEVVKVTD